MKCILINCIYNSVRAEEPLGVTAVCGYLRNHGWEVEIIDPSIYGWGTRVTAEECLHARPEVIGLSVISSDAEYLDDVADFVTRIRAGGFTGMFVAGGRGASLGYRELLLRIPEIACVVVGEGEETMSSLLTKLYAQEDWRHLPGIAYCDDGDIQRNLPRRKIQASDITWLARDTLPNRMKRFGPGVYACILASRGCWHNCSFCCEPSYQGIQPGPSYRSREVTDVLDEMQNLYELYGATSFLIYDEHFIWPGKHGEQKLRDMKAALEQWPQAPCLCVLTRVDSITPVTAKLLKECNVRIVYLGIESFDDEDLILYNKGSKCNDIVAALDALTAVGYGAAQDGDYRIAMGMIVFHPWSTLRSVQRNHEFCKAYSLRANLFTKMLAIIPGSALASRFLATFGSYTSSPVILDPRVAAIAKLAVSLRVDVCYLDDLDAAAMYASEMLRKDADLTRIREIRRTASELYYQVIGDALSGIRDVSSEDLNRTWRRALGDARKRAKSICSRASVDELLAPILGELGLTRDELVRYYTTALSI